MNVFKLDFEVRDNEVDMQGIVNNANYYIYLAHARHKFLNEIGINFSEMTTKKQFLLLTASYIEFKHPLKAGDKFYVTCKLLPEGKIKFAFEQEIYRLDDKKTLIVKSKNVGVCIDGNNKNRPYIPNLLQSLLPK